MLGIDLHLSGPVRESLCANRERLRTDREPADDEAPTFVGREVARRRSVGAVAVDGLDPHGIEFRFYGLHPAVAEEPARARDGGAVRVDHESADVTTRRVQDQADVDGVSRLSVEEVAQRWREAGGLGSEGDAGLGEAHAEPAIPAGVPDDVSLDRAHSAPESCASDRTSARIQHDARDRDAGFQQNLALIVNCGLDREVVPSSEHAVHGDLVTVDVGQLCLPLAHRTANQWKPSCSQTFSSTSGTADRSSAQRTWIDTVAPAESSSTSPPSGEHAATRSRKLDCARPRSLVTAAESAVDSVRVRSALAADTGELAGDGWWFANHAPPSPRRTTRSKPAPSPALAALVRSVMPASSRESTPWTTSNPRCKRVIHGPGGQTNSSHEPESGRRAAPAPPLQGIRADLVWRAKASATARAAVAGSRGDRSESRR